MTRPFVTTVVVFRAQDGRRRLLVDGQQDCPMTPTTVVEDRATFGRQSRSSVIGAEDSHQARTTECVAGKQNVNSNGETTCR